MDNWVGTMDVGAWLRGLGLERYETTFRDNEIDGTVVPNLTADDLKDLGVTIVGHRRKLLDAIAALRDDKNMEAAPVAPQPIDTPAKNTAERRQVTVMFSDLVGSTALSARMDPEDLREIISAYQKCVAETVRRFDGFIAKYLGDGALVYFGYPAAHEDDAARAVRAGLELIAEVARLVTRAPLQTRVGIATGLVVVGDLIGSGEAQERGIVGETPNLAARLQGIADPDMVVIADSTRRLVGNLFELQDLGPRDLKGITVSARAWAALRARAVESRFEALHGTALTALIGRDEEIDLLLRRWSRAKTGEGQVVLLSGEAGIGKSRLTASLMEHLVNEPHIRLRYFCSPQHTDSALYPIIGQMERAAGFTHEDAPATKLDKLDALLAQTPTPIRDAALFAEMLSLPNDGRYPALELAAQERRHRTLQALIWQVETLTRQSPVLMIFEDAHWTDPTSLELFGWAVSRIADLRVLLIVTFRPEFDPPWIGQSHVMALTINRLGQRHVGDMINRVVGNKLLPASIRQEIIERTDGIPLFVEEMTKAVLEAESEADARRTAAAIPSSAIAVPPSLHASLMARLDRLGPAKEVAQIAAAIGREFSHTLLAAIVRKPEAEVRSALDRLIGASLLFRQGTPPQASYLFKHALVQDAAYSTLLRDARRALHAHIAEVLESRFPEIAESQPELLARHCTEAGLIEQAANLWGKAGQRSLERSAAMEAAAQLTRALGQIAALPGTPALRRSQTAFQVSLAIAVMQTKGYAAPDTKTAFDQARSLVERANELGEPPEDPLQLFSVLYGFWVTNLVAFNGDILRELAIEFLALAEKQRVAVPIMIGHRLMGTSLTWTGNLVEGRAHYNQAISLYDPSKHRLLATRFGQDVGVVILTQRSITSWILGYPEAAIADAEQALKAAREIGQATTLMYALSTANVYIWSGNYITANTLLEELIALADERQALYWKGLVTIFQSWLMTVTDKPSDAVHAMTSGLAAFRSTGSTMWTPLHLSYLARAHAELNQFEEAWRCLREAMAVAGTTKERWHEAEVYRTVGQIALLSPQPDAAKAEEQFDRALALARGQQAKSWELRAAMSMARLWRDQGKRQQAHDLLTPVYNWFTEGFDTLDLKQAKALLEQLSA